MEVLLLFLAASFATGVRSASDDRLPEGRIPGRRLLLALALVASVALLSHRFA